MENLFAKNLPGLFTIYGDYMLTEIVRLHRSKHVWVMAIEIDQVLCA